MMLLPSLGSPYVSPAMGNGALELPTCSLLPPLPCRVGDTDPTETPLMRAPLIAEPSPHV